MNWIKYLPFAASIAKLGIASLLAKKSTLTADQRAALASAAIASIESACK